jgi:hypothetical protein
MSNPISHAILQTLTYAELFDYPLTPSEVCHYLIGVRATREEIERMLSDSAQLAQQIVRVDGFLTLPQREKLVDVRLRRQADAQQQWPRARTYARLIAHFPFVRMVALTGALAMANARDGDIDFLIVTRPGHLWLVRGLSVALVRLARLRGDQLCPNFLLSENALAIPEHNIYQAHEIVQMIPLYGFEVYRRMRQCNQWALQFLPNADAMRGADTSEELSAAVARFKRWCERLLSGALGKRIERWEMNRKVRKLSAQVTALAAESRFSADVCRGFLSGHGTRVMNAFQTRTTQADATLHRSV